MTLDTLGVTALLYALAGYWTGRYGETTGRDRAHAPLLAVARRHDRDRVRRLRPPLPARRGRVGAARALRRPVAGLALNLLLAGPVFALCRGRAAQADDPTASPRCGSLASSYPERRSPSRRFLPPDPRVDGAVPLHAAARAPRRRARPRSRSSSSRVLFLRLWALQVLSGDRYLLAAQNNQLRTVPRRGAARLDPRPRRQHDRLERARHGGADLDGRPAQGGPLRDVQAALEGPARAAAAADAGARGGQGRPADADPRQDGRARGPGGDAAGAPRRVPRASRSSARTCATTSTGRSRRSSSATSARSRRRSSKRLEDGRLPRRREDRQDRGRGGVRHLPPRQGGHRAAPRRLARPAAGRVHRRGGPPSRATTSG